MKVNAESTKRGMKATRHVRINKGDTVQEQLSCLQDQHDELTAVKQLKALGIYDRKIHTIRNTRNKVTLKSAH